MFISALPPNSRETTCRAVKSPEAAVFIWLLCSVIQRFCKFGECVTVEMLIAPTAKLQHLFYGLKIAEMDGTGSMVMAAEPLIFLGNGK